MFTGLVVERGEILRAAPSPKGGRELEIGLTAELASGLEIGASLAVNGCCLTVVEHLGEGEQRAVRLELSPETLERTTLGGVGTGDHVNLEPALSMGQPLGGHWVQGHVDGTTTLVERVPDQDFETFWWRLPAEHARSFVEKGSVTVDGVSLTVAALREDAFAVALIPHTLEVTTLGALEVGEASNLEVDVLAKYIDKALGSRLDAIEAALERIAPGSLDR